MRRLCQTVACIALAMLAMLPLMLVGCDSNDSRSFAGSGTGKVDVATPQEHGFSPSDVPTYSGKLSVKVNGNAPFFTDDDRVRSSFEKYSPLDSLGRCGIAFAIVGPETMPSEERGSIGMIKPSGWQTVKYDWVDGSYLYNRCHLIAYALSSENDNELNLITGTRSMNVLGMLPYEEETAAYIDRTQNHVLYRVTPVFEGDNLVADGVLMEAESLEDSGRGIRFCVWCYNVEPGVSIDYATGKSHADGTYPNAAGGAGAIAASGGQGNSGEAIGASNEGADQAEAVQTYVLNTNTHRFHHPDCPSVSDMKEKNKLVYEGTREEIIDQGYRPCGVCKP